MTVIHMEAEIKFVQDYPLGIHIVFHPFIGSLSGLRV
jgi:hypothetical protein